MSELPTPQTLAKLVNGVTETMFGLSFSIAEEDLAASGSGGPPWRTVVLPISGKRPLTVAISSDEKGGRQLGGAMFSCAPSEVDRSMIDDSLNELVNIVAGQIKSAMGLDQALGLPRVLETARENGSLWHSATIRNSKTSVTVWVAVSESLV